MKKPEKSGRVKETAAPARIKDAGPFAPAENTATNTGKTINSNHRQIEIVCKVF